MKKLLLSALLLLFANTSDAIQNSVGGAASQAAAIQSCASAAMVEKGNTTFNISPALGGVGTLAVVLDEVIGDTNNANYYVVYSSNIAGGTYGTFQVRMGAYTTLGITSPSASGSINNNQNVNGNYSGEWLSSSNLIRVVYNYNNGVNTVGHTFDTTTGTLVTSEQDYSGASDINISRNNVAADPNGTKSWTMGSFGGKEYTISYPLAGADTVSATTVTWISPDAVTLNSNTQELYGSAKAYTSAGDQLNCFLRQSYSSPASAGTIFDLNSLCGQLGSVVDTTNNVFYALGSNLIRATLPGPVFNKSVLVGTLSPLSVSTKLYPMFYDATIDKLLLIGTNGAGNLVALKVNGTTLAVESSVVSSLGSSPSTNRYFGFIDKTRFLLVFGGHTSATTYALSVMSYCG